MGIKQPPIKWIPSALEARGKEPGREAENTLLSRGSVRGTRCLGPTMTARGQSTGISIGMLPQTLIMSITVQKTSKYYTTEFDLEGL